MTSLRLATWNVLHRVHALNWSETSATRFPVEAERIRGVTETVGRWLDAGVDVVCLQEVSGDQLASLRQALGGTRSVFEHTYPRVPRVRGDGASQLIAPSEHLVTIATAPDATRVEGCTSAEDPGKGYLAVVLRGVMVVGAHVSFGPRGARQLAVLARAAWAHAGPAVVLGDFNVEHEGARAGLGEGFTLAELGGQRATRTPTADKPGRTIDHVAGLRATIEAAEVLDGEGLSDHHPVHARVRP